MKFGFSISSRYRSLFVATYGLFKGYKLFVSFSWDTSAPKYLASLSEWISVEPGDTTNITVFMQPAAIGIFELSDRLKGRVDTSHVFIESKVTDLTTQTLILPVARWHTTVQHSVILALTDPTADPSAALKLPAGSYRLDYEVRPYDKKWRVVEGSCYRGSTTVELVMGQVTAIAIGD